MRPPHTFVIPALPLLLAGLFAASPLGAQRAVPIENDHVRVVVVTDPPNRKGRMHEHSMNRVMVYLDAGHQQIRWQDGRVDDLKFQPGEPLWSAAGGMHTSENVGGAPYRIVEIELRRTGRKVRFPAADPVRAAPQVHRVLMENDQVRVLKASIPHGARLARHEHTLPGVLVPLTDYTLRVTDSMGRTSTASGKAAEVLWVDPAAHSEENVGPTAELLLVEIK